MSYSVSQTLNIYAAAQTAPEAGAMNAEACVDQIGRMNVAAISGGRVISSDNAIVMPVASGYHVVVSLDASDTYTVRRVYTRKGKATVKAEWINVYADMVGEVAYAASCFR